MPRKSVVAVVGTGEETEPAISNAREIGRLVAQNAWVLVTGGRDAGVMKAANEGAKEIEGSLTIGILPKRETDVSPAVDVPIISDVGEARNNIIVLSADVVIACSVNDPGTASEVSLALKAQKPVILFAAPADAQEFFNKIGSENIYIASSPAEAVKMAERLISS